MSLILCALTEELTALSIRAANSVGGGMIAVDILESESGEMLVLEVNHAFEFRRAQRVVDFDIAGRIAVYVVASIS